MPQIVISYDEAKKKLQGYDPGKAELFHVESAKIADKEFARALKVFPGKNVILMSGGSASGKTEFVSGYLGDFQGIIFDSTLPSIKGAEIKIKKILKANKIPIIYAVFPDDLERAFTAFLNRDRKFSDAHFYRTHSSSRATLYWIAQHYPQIEMKIFESRYVKRGDMSFYEYKIVDHEQLLGFLKKSQYTEDEIISIIKKI
jgi:hypothetical protein